MIEAMYIQHTHSLRHQLVDVLDAYGQENPSIPLTCVLDALGETLVNISVQQMGVPYTQKYCEELLESVRQHMT